MFAKNTIFEGKVAHGLLILSLAVGFLAPLVAGTMIALDKVDAWFPRPVKIGDTIYVDFKVVDKRPSEKYHGGAVTFRHEVRNQWRQPVAVIHTDLLIARGIATRDNVRRRSR